MEEKGMPELPDVEVMRRYLDATSLHQEIREVDLLDEKVLNGVSADTLRARMRGREISSSDRHGKHLFARIDGTGYLVMHFGMTGFLRYYRNEEERPGHARMILWFSGGYRLAYDLQRRLGRLGWAGDIRAYVKHRGLGPDPLSVDPDAFVRLLEGRRGMVKPALMDQGLVAGIGNIYSDEILYHADLHPRAEVPKLTEDQVRRLYECMRRVLQVAVDAQADPGRMPDDWLTPVRGEERTCPRCGGKLEKKKIGGRSSWYCSGHQHR
jgi:formamidopyrimidine-DNA glycosylase